MTKLKQGDKGAEVQKLQIRLNDYGYGLATDGIFGAKTAAALKDYQRKNGLSETGEYDEATAEKIAQKQRKFIVLLDAGHGGLDPNTLKYATRPENGKKYQHPTSKKLHDDNGWFYEGIENRIVVNMVAEELTKLDIEHKIVSHAYLEYWNVNTNGQELRRRANAAVPLLQNGYCGLLYSFHSNAAPTWIENKEGVKIRKRTKEELDAIVGCEVYTDKENTLSDLIAQRLAQLWDKHISSDWTRGNGLKQADFAILDVSEEIAKKYGHWAAILEEFGVYTSQADAEKIIELRPVRVRCAVELIKEAMHMIK